MRHRDGSWDLLEFPGLLGSQAPAQIMTIEHKHPPNQDYTGHKHPPEPRLLDTSTNHSDGHWAQASAKTATPGHKHPPKGGLLETSTHHKDIGHKHPPKQRLLGTTGKDPESNRNATGKDPQSNRKATGKQPESNRKAAGAHPQSNRGNDARQFVSRQKMFSNFLEHVCKTVVHPGE